MAERYVVRDKVSGEYLAEKFIRGVFFTSDISKAVRFKSSNEAQVKLYKQDLISPTSLVVDQVFFS